MVNSDSVAVATFPTPGGRVEYRGDVAIAGVPGTAAPVVLDFPDTEGSATGAPAAHRATSGTPSTASRSPASTTACRSWWRMAESFGLTGYETHEQLAADTALLERIDAFRLQGRAADGPGRRGRVVGAEDRPARRAPGRRPGLHPLVHPGAAAHRHRRAGRGQRRHRHAAARRGRATSSPRTGRSDSLAGRRRAPHRPPAGRRGRRRRAPSSAGRPLGRRPHRPQALRRHRLSREDTGAAS